MTTERKTWQQILLNRRMVTCLFLGFTSGMPLYVLVQLAPAWLRDHGVSLSTIGLFALIQIPYTWKFLWSPLMDRFQLPLLGLRRGWMLLTQVGLLLTIAAMGWFDPNQSLRTIVVLVVIVAAFSASQDIVIDAYRRELLADEELGIGNSLAINAYRFSSLVPGSLALILADHLSWQYTFHVVAGFMGVGIVTTLVIREVSDAAHTPRTIREAVVEPFREFLQRDGIKSALSILLFMLLYKLGDSMATALSTPFYLDLGFTKTQIGTIAKAATLGSSIVGGIIGGVVMLKLSINRALWVFGVVQMASILGFAFLSEVGSDPYALFAVVSFEYLGVGMGTVAFTAFIARATSRHHTATQFALLTSLAVIPRVFTSATTGFIIEAVGYTRFFYLCTLLAIPGMLMLFKVAPWREKSE